MQFVHAWDSLSPLDLLRLLAAPAFLLLGVVIPGRAPARISALGIAASLPYLRELALPLPLFAGWLLLWLAIAVLAGRGEAPVAAVAPDRPGGFEPGTVGLLVGGSLLLLLLAAVARQDLDPDPARRATLAVLLITLALVHLMVRRQAFRAAVAFGAYGLGLELIESLARARELEPSPPNGWVLIATAAAVGLVARLATEREALTGNVWVSDAHDLHD